MRYNFASLGFLFIFIYHYESSAKNFHALTNSVESFCNNKNKIMKISLKIVEPLLLYQSEVIGKDVELSCMALGIPQARIFWTKNGRRITQSATERADISVDRYSGKNLTSQRVAITASRLILKNVDLTDEGVYGCSAVNDCFKPVTSTTRLEILDINDNDNLERQHRKQNAGEPAQIYMWTKSRLELQYDTAQLACRAKGQPTPHIHWWLKGKDLSRDSRFQILESGDLLIKKSEWNLMGTYICTAKNKFGVDSKESFFYPTMREDENSTISS